ncbi:MAG TPA: DUF3298 domain-containing protein [Candidatus Paceibacterota bacterium]|nr:DUF3298 domain-containing protein [Candidatus Paceibacterota bacterium]
MPPTLHQHKKWIILAICIAIIIVFVVVGYKSAKAPVNTQTTTTPSTIEWPSEQVKKETITESNKAYDITAYYPDTKDDSITGQLKTFVQGQVDSFKQDMTDAGPLPDGYPPATFTVSYEEQKNDRADNYIFTTYSDTGGAHGLSSTQTFVYLKDGTLVTLDDLFTNGTLGIGTVADYVKAALLKSKVSDANWISGADPTEDNYKDFTIDASGVTFLFDPYQVAPYSSGPQKVTVPVSVFKTIANPGVFEGQ